MADARFVEIRGTEFVNKGAELMMRAILDRLPSGWVPVVEVSRRNTRRQLGDVGVRAKRTGVLALPFRADDVPEEAVSVVLDASGYAYSDFWGPGRARSRLGRHVDRWKARGTTVILLPQAFGPFEGADLRRVMSRALDRADLVFPRDPTSLGHVAGLGLSAPVHLAPDFTNLLGAPAPPDADRLRRTVLVVPNRRMIQAGTRGYGDALTASMDRIRSSGYEPALLVQETGRDPGLARRLACRLSPAVPVILESSAVAIKGIIGASAAVVTSRYHSLVCALSQGVPSVATSWSHKYRHLVEEYGYERALVPTPESLPAAVSELLDPAVLERDRSHLLDAAEPVRDRARAMWELVFETIERRP
jgi:colanic acid/amylovoran biosynthesis protein